MTTQEMTKKEMIMNLREKREEKKKAKLKAKHRRCTIAIITLVAMMTVIFGTVYSASAKEITITEINEFAGTNETKTDLFRYRRHSAAPGRDADPPKHGGSVAQGARQRPQAVSVHWAQPAHDPAFAGLWL